MRTCAASKQSVFKGRKAQGHSHHFEGRECHMWWACDFFAPDQQLIELQSNFTLQVSLVSFLNSTSSLVKVAMKPCEIFTANGHEH